MQGGEKTYIMPSKKDTIFSPWWMTTQKNNMTGCFGYKKSETPATRKKEN